MPTELYHWEWLLIHPRVDCRKIFYLSQKIIVGTKSCRLCSQGPSTSDQASALCVGIRQLLFKTAIYLPLTRIPFYRKALHAEHSVVMRLVRKKLLMGGLGSKIMMSWKKATPF